MIDKAKLTATILGIITAIVLVAQNVFGVTLLGDTDPGTLAQAIVTLVVVAFGIWKAIAEKLAEQRAQAAEAQNDELQKEIAALEAIRQVEKAEYEKALAGIK